jgi:hypothetical protein
LNASFNYGTGTKSNLLDDGIDEPHGHAGRERRAIAARLHAQAHGIAIARCWRVGPVRAAA